jgi:ketosteroid isomerase-like protein
MGEQLFAPLYKRFEGKYTSHATRLIADGDIVVVEARGRATLKGGGDYNNSYCFVCEFNGAGKIKQVTEYMDTDLAVRVLGAPAVSLAT